MGPIKSHESSEVEERGWRDKYKDGITTKVQPNVASFEDKALGPPTKECKEFLHAGKGKETILP